MSINRSSTKVRLLGMGGIISVLGLGLGLVHGFAITNESLIGIGVVLLIFGTVWKGRTSDPSIDDSSPD